MKASIAGQLGHAEITLPSLVAAGLALKDKTDADTNKVKN